MIIRDATVDDSLILAALGAASFSGAFGDLYTPDNLRTFLTEFHSETYYNRALADPNITIRIAEEAGRAVAYYKTGPNTLPCDPPLPQALELSRLYVDADLPGRGIGSQLMDDILTRARNAAYADIVLSVWEHNDGAKRFYERYGFTDYGANTFRVGTQTDRDRIYRLRLEG